jgi:hypothetical protein
MMFRHAADPLYYDTKANSKIFVPQVNESEMTEDKLKIIESFPKEDRGEILEAAEYTTKGYGEGHGDDIGACVEMDQLEAAKKMNKMKQAIRREKEDRIKRDKAGKLDFKEDKPEENEENAKADKKL